MVEIISAWPNGLQLTLAMTVAVLLTFFTFLALVLCARYMTIILRGWPPPKPPDPEPSLTRRLIKNMECEHEENLTGWCLLEGKNCGTRAECDRTIEARNKDQLPPIAAPESKDLKATVGPRETERAWD